MAWQPASLSFLAPAYLHQWGMRSALYCGSWANSLALEGDLPKQLWDVTFCGSASVSAGEPPAKSQSRSQPVCKSPLHGAPHPDSCCCRPDHSCQRSGSSACASSTLPGVCRGRLDLRARHSGVSAGSEPYCGFTVLCSSADCCACSVLSDFFCQGVATGIGLETSQPDTT